MHGISHQYVKKASMIPKSTLIAIMTTSGSFDSSSSIGLIELERNVSIGGG